MATTPTTAAVSHVGKIRASNQDSGYLGRHLYVVADGMGGHAGGDIASAIAAQRIAEADREYATAEDAVMSLQSALIAANGLLAETVFEHNELTGMGTTVSALVRVRDQLALAHIGDSRVYLFRDGELTQITTDHTFVQRLVESGRITPEEAAVHPRRAVLMRVLGDVDASPEIDTGILDTQPGDRWLLCSDGLSGYVSEEKVVQILRTIRTAQGAADRLVKESLDHGAPDNVTVLLIDVDDSDGASGSAPVFVGSAAQPLSFAQEEVARKPIRLPTLLLHPLKPTPPEDSHFEPESESYLDELIEEDRRRSIRRRIMWGVGVTLAAIAIVLAGYLGYRWTQMHYYVGVSDGNVAIFKGVQQSIGPISLSSVYQTTAIDLDELPSYQREAVEATISAESLRDAHDIVDRLAAVTGG
ncbi:PP2C family serine/threonine-protein phosphatase [Homoserinibacter sp. GY 40078]|uniref:PP2C family protein-serine/threonine phosphatase n=1 Tax=Homoserinibacter sp. GY 40078 TaxID=2603275 RepID=UPI0011C73EDC|nr:PP2C family serine/threonine-protein phosphatase [Homoserinibacter sp. GY 40078]TXK18885.1 serine/threonine-protein phosphatase [Homoserinibacter sp. GY 40078]